MNTSQKICWSAVLITIIICGCAKIQSKENGHPSERELIDKFRQAHDRRDLQGMLDLFCWDGVTTELREVTEDAVKTSFDDKILTVKIISEHPKGRVSQYIKNGVTYGFNVPIEKELVIETPFLPKAEPLISYYPLGVRGGHYVIAQMAPVSKAAAQSTKTTAPALLQSQNSM